MTMSSAECWLERQYDRLKAENADIKAENVKLRELLDFALPIAMYAASTEEGDRIREMMKEVDE